MKCGSRGCWKKKDETKSIIYFRINISKLLHGNMPEVFIPCKYFNTFLVINFTFVLIIFIICDDIAV